MNKKSKIIVGVIALILVMVVGYATFSETIQINGTATAKGDFSVTATCEKGINSNFSSMMGELEDIPKEGGYENDYCTVNDAGTKVSFHSDLKYPGAARYFTVKITNTGTIVAAWNLQDGFKLIQRKTCVDGANGNLNGSIEEDECKEYSSLNESEIYQVVTPVGASKTDGTIITMMDDDFYDFMDDKGENIILKPKESVYLIMFNEFRDSYGNNGSGSFYLTSATDLELTFTQKTN